MTSTDLGLIERLGWDEPEQGRFLLVSGRRAVELRCLFEPVDMVPLEELQREVMGAPDLEIYGRATLVTVPDTGGHVVGAYVVDPDGGETLAGALIGLGGFVAGAPRIVSDWMGVWPCFRSAGVGAALKRAQAILALRAGFREVVWTVDPLRAANARLNHGVLGAVAHSYAVDRYGSEYAAGLYGRMPSDRLIVRWAISDPSVQDRLVSPPPMATVDDLRSLDDRVAGEPMQGFVEIPPDIDALLAADPVGARGQRERVRGELVRAFDAGAVVSGFAAAGRAGRPALVLSSVGGAP